MLLTPQREISVLEIYLEYIHTGLWPGASKCNPISAGAHFKTHKLLSSSSRSQAHRRRASAMGFSYSLVTAECPGKWLSWRRAQTFWWKTWWSFTLHEMYLPSGGWGSLFTDLSLIMEHFKFIISSAILIETYLWPWKLRKNIFNQSKFLKIVELLLFFSDSSLLLY